MRPNTLRIKSLILPFVFLSTFAFGQKPGSHTGLDFENGENVNISDHSSLNPRNAMTVEAWIKPDAFGSNVWTNSIVDKHDWASGNAGYVLRCGSGGVLSWNFASRSTGSWVETNSSAVLQTGVWYHVAGTFDGDTAKVYINGVLQNSTANTTTINISSSDITIGAMTFGKGRDFDGSIDEVRIWSSALSDTALRDYMCRKIDRLHPNYSDLEGYWKLDEGTGSTTADASSNSNSGTLSNNQGWIESGAALGDSSWHVYTSSNITVQTNYGETIEVKNITGSPACTHIYVVNSGSSKDMGPDYYAILDSTHYFGVFQGGGTSPTFDLAYDYSGNRTYGGGTNDHLYDILENGSGSNKNWVSTNGKIFFSKDSVSRLRQTSKEYTNAIYPKDSTLYVKSSNGKTWFCEGESITLIAAGNDSFVYKWYKNDTLLSNSKNKLVVSTSGKYRAESTRNGTTSSFKSITLSITATKKPNVQLTSLKGVCENVDTIVLQGGTPAGGVYSGVNIKDDSLFFPSRVGSGSYQVVYSYTDPTTTCTAHDTANQVVFGLPNVMITSTNDFCDNIDSSAVLYGTPTGGTYTGLGIRNNHFHPGLVNYKAGLYAYTYSYTDTNGCSNRADDSLVLYASPNVFLLPIRPSCLKDAPIPLKGSPTQGTYTGKGISGTQFIPKDAGAGSHEITYSFTNSDGCSNSDTQTAVVYENTQVSWTPSFAPCVNADSIALSGGSPTGGVYVGSGIRNGYFHPDAAGAGDHDLSYVFTDTNSCKNTVVYKATVHDTTVLSGPDTASMCPGPDSVELQTVLPLGGTYHGDGLKGIYFMRDSMGIGFSSAKYTLTNAQSCVSNKDFTIEVIKPDSVSVSLPASVCDGASPLRVDVYPTGGTLAGTGIIGSFFSPDFAGIGEHEISYTFTESHQCEVKKTAKITVSEIPEVKLSLPKTSFCSDDNDQPLLGGTPTGGVFSVNGAAQDTFKPSENATGPHQIKYVFTNQYSCADSMEQTVYLNPIPSKPNITNQDGELKSSASKGNQWHNVQGPISGATGQTYRPNQSGRHWVVVTSDSGCTNQSVHVDFEFINVTNLENINWTIYPNPGTGIFHVQNWNSNLRFSLYDATGRLVLEGDLKQSNDWSHLQTGPYQLLVGDGEMMYRSRLVIQR